MRLPSTPISNIVNGHLRAFKVARLVQGADGPTFRGAGLGTAYGPVDQAVCVSNREHVPPCGHCGCGFYGVKHRERAVRLIDDERVALLEVGLWGRFEEFEHGFIAAAQSVVQVTLIRYCVSCLSDGDRQVRAAVALAGQPGRNLAPVCDLHTEAAGSVVRFEDLTERWGVKVGWATLDDPVCERALKIGVAQEPLLARNVRLLDALLPGEIGHVFANALAADGDGNLWIDPVARLIQPMPGTDVPVRLNQDGEHEVLLDGLIRFEGWQPRTDFRRFALPVRAVGELRITSGEQAS